MEFVDEPEVSFEIIRTTRTSGTLWPIGFMIILGVLVAIGLASPDAPEHSVAAAGAGSDITDLPPTSASPGVPESPSSLTVLIPEAGQVILGSSMPVAGRLAPSGRAPRSADAVMVHVIVRDGDAVLGAGDIPIVNHMFVGCITIDVPPPNGRAVRITLVAATVGSDPHPEVAFILGPGSTDRNEDVPCASDPRQVRGVELRSGS